jgi:hypothetical protein
MAKMLKDLSAQEVLALAIQSEEEDGRIYADLAERVGHRIIPPRPSRSRPCAMKRTAIAIASSSFTANVSASTSRSSAART